MNTLFLWILFAVTITVRAATPNEFYRNYYKTQLGYNDDVAQGGMKFPAAYSRYLEYVRDDNPNKEYNQSYSPRNIQRQNVLDIPDLEGRKELQRTYNIDRYKQNDRDQNRIDMWDFYRLKNVENWNDIHSEEKDKLTRNYIADSNRYNIIGRQGLGFERRTAWASGLRAPITPKALEIVGKRQGRFT